MSNDMLLPDAEVKDAIETAKSFVIKSREDYALVDAHCSGLLKLKNKIEADFSESKATTYKAWKAVVAQEKGHLDGIDAARRIDKTKMVEWQEVEERERKVAEDMARAEAKKKADDAALALAQEAQAAGEHEQAEAIINTPVEVPVIVIPKDLPKTATTIQTRWDYRVTDLALVPREFLMLDTVKIGQVVRAMKGDTNIAGIEAFSRKI